ncbi:hypothetical protein HY085_01250 [Candidatus Gottesmanbacteria bacterium]|nr:hypothetical protein [Candidatus Gottesmanbacteria bacterium]
MEANVASLTRLVSGGNQGVASLIGLTLQTPPVSGKDFLAYERAKFHVPGTPTPVYAAIGGLGYNSLGPVLQIWVVMRNLAYFIFAIVFVVIGLMILIRAKIDPKTTINIQNALPKIILALVLVTFSYAIAGFLIDIMYVALALVLTIAGSINIKLNATSANNPIDLGKNILEHNLFWGFFDGNTWGSIGNASQAVMTAITTFITGQQTGLLGPIGDILKGLGGGIVMLIIAIAILWALFKTWLSLLSAYANTILGIIFSPLQLMMDAIPGQNQFEGWLRTMLSNLLAFPAVLAMILIGLILANTNEGNPGGVLGFSPPLIGASDQRAIQALIGIAIILTIPKTVEMLQKTLKAPENKWGSAWNEMINAARVGMTTTGQTAWQKYGESSLSGYRTYRKEGVRKGIGDTFVAEGKAKGASVGGSPLSTE